LPNMRKIGVVGAGMMGSEIALVFALAGHPVILTDQDLAHAQAALDRLSGVSERGVQRGFWSEEAANSAKANLKAAAGDDAFADRDLVVEAVFEDLAVKQEVFRRLDAVLAPEAGLASNTSSISITTLAAAVRPERRRRFVGTHFFSPVSRMKLVELIPGLDSDARYVTAVEAALRAVGKTPIRVKDVVGFAVNRLLHAMVLEAIRLVEEGVCSPTDIDVGCRLGLGHSIGPFELMDNTANSLSLSVHEILHKAYGERFQPRPLLKQLVEAGYNGRKAGRGWHRYDASGKRATADEASG
jgi:3-hydroxybutyryl-CoA dehydrogenase